MALQKSSQTNHRVIRFLYPSPPAHCFKPLIYFSSSSRLNDAYTVLKLHSLDIRKRGALINVAALSTRMTELELGLEEANDTDDTFSNHQRILLSDVIVKRPRKLFGEGRRWNSLDLATAGVVLAMHVLSLFAPFYFNWSAFYVALSLYFITGLFGLTLSFHRNLSHRSFKLPKWLEYSFAYCGVLALQVLWQLFFSFSFGSVSSGMIIYVCFWFTKFYINCRGIQLVGWILIDIITSSLIPKETPTAPWKVSGLATWTGYLMILPSRKRYIYYYRKQGRNALTTLENMIGLAR